MSMQSTAIFDRRVYARDTAPDDERDGVIWVDTSNSPRETYVYSTDTGSWEPVAAEKQLVAGGWDDVTASRSIDVEYQNTTGGPLDVSMMFETDMDSRYMRGALYVLESSGSTEVIRPFYNRNSLSTGVFDNNTKVPLQALVPDGYYYEVRGGVENGTMSVYEWYEQEVALENV